MDKNIILVSVLLGVCLSLVSCLQPFSKGNLLVLKKSETPFREKTFCAAGALVELTPDGQIVQEFYLPTTATEDGPACLLFNQQIMGQATLSTDGHRAIIPCCNIDQDSTATGSYISFAIVRGDGSIEITPILSNTFKIFPTNAVLDGEDIWCLVAEANPLGIVYMSLNSTVATTVYSGSVDHIQIHNGDLYAACLYHECTVLQFDGLPTELTNDTTNHFGPSPLISFAFVDNDRVVLNAVQSFLIYNTTSEELILATNETDDVKIWAFVPLFEQNKVIAQVTTDVDPRIPLIYSFPWNDTSYFGSLDDATLLLSPQDGFFYASPIRVPIHKCLDEVKNFNETDVDCGGSLCVQRCAAGQHCLFDADCTTNSCIDNTCTQTPTSAPSSDPVAEPVTSPSGPITSQPIAVPTNSPQASLVSSASSLVATTFLASAVFVMLYLP